MEIQSFLSELKRKIELTEERCMGRIRVTDLNANGYGISPDNEYVPIPFSLPGDILELYEDSDGIPLINKVITPSQNRVSPPCSQFGVCGGCSLQHASDEFVLNWKVLIVENELLKRGISVKFLQPISVPEFSRRRAVFSGRRTKKAELVGFNSRCSHLICSAEGCKVVSHEIMDFYPAIKLLTCVGCSRNGTIRIGVTVSENGLDVVVQNAKYQSIDIRNKIYKLLQVYRVARLTWNDEVLFFSDEPYQIFGNTRVVPPPGAFLQATLEGQTAILDYVHQAISGASRVLDLFSGCGVIALSIAQKASVLAVDKSTEMIDTLNIACKKAGVKKPVATCVRNLFKYPFSEEELDSFETVIFDPPRSGALNQCKFLAKSNVQRIVAISCNPKTFSRDAEILVNGGYKLTNVQVIDQFRWSHHIETVATFERCKKKH